MTVEMHYRGFFFLIIIDYQYLAAFHTQRKRNVRRCVR